LSISSEKNYCTDLCISSATSKSGTNVLIMLASLIRPIRSKLLWRRVNSIEQQPDKDLVTCRTGLRGWASADSNLSYCS